MKILLLLEPPQNVTATITNTSPRQVTVSWDNVEDDRAYSEVTLYCREQGETEWVLCKVINKENVTQMVQYVDHEDQIPFAASTAYEFAMTTSIPVFPAGPQDSAKSDISTVEF